MEGFLDMVRDITDGLFFKEEEFSFLNDVAEDTGEASVEVIENMFSSVEEAAKFLWGLLEGGLQIQILKWVVLPGGFVYIIIKITHRDREPVFH
ncbi:MAG: hypothetical protein AAB439_00060 [Patescibacteria group bacterium]